MSPPSSPIAITGLALASPFGSDVETFWQGVLHGPAPITRWTPADYPGMGDEDIGCLAGRLPDLPPLGRGGAGGRALWLAEDLVRRALAHAGYAAAPPGCGLALGSAFGELDHYARPKFLPAPPALPQLGKVLGLTGPSVTTPVNCAAGNVAIAWAVGRLRAGHAPVMVAGGLDVIGSMAVGAYRFLDNLTTTIPRPFAADRDGFLLAEGGALFVLEPFEVVRAAGRPIYGVIEGVGGGHDGSHPTRPAPDGRGLVGAMRRTLRDAGLEAAAVGYVNAHSPGTEANDEAEAAAIATVFGACGVPVSSTKGVLGHAQGGANPLEAVVCLLALRDGLLPPTHHTVEAAPGLEIDLVTGSPRPTLITHALSVAASMGGATSVLLLGKGDADVWEGRG